MENDLSMFRVDLARTVLSQSRHLYPAHKKNMRDSDTSKFGGGDTRDRTKMGPNDLSSFIGMANLPQKAHTAYLITKKSIDKQNRALKAKSKVRKQSYPGNQNSAESDSESDQGVGGFCHKHGHYALPHREEYNNKGVKVIHVTLPDARTASYASVASTDLESRESSRPSLKPKAITPTIAELYYHPSESTLNLTNAVSTDAVSAALNKKDFRSCDQWNSHDLSITRERTEDTLCPTPVNMVYPVGAGLAQAGLQPSKAPLRIVPGHVSLLQGTKSHLHQ